MREKKRGREGGGERENAFLFTYLDPLPPPLMDSPNASSPTSTPSRHMNWWYHTIQENGPHELPTKFVKYQHKSLTSEFPVNKDGRRFSTKNYLRRVCSDVIFCFCCRLFVTIQMSLSSESGYSDWKHMSELLSEHETSPHHMKAYQSWSECSQRLHLGKMIDSENHRILPNETERWRENLAFRGKSDLIYQRNNRNFLKILAFIGKFDVIIADHLQRITSKQSYVHYLRENIQNEIISMLGSKIRQTILNEEKNHVHKRKFLGFVQINSSTGDALTDILVTQLKEIKISLHNIHGEGYDNGAIQRASGIDAVTSFCYQIGEIYDVLYELSVDPRTDAFGKNTAISLARKQKSFKLVCCLIVWHAILFTTNMVRKVLQRENMDISTAVELIVKIKSYSKHMQWDEGLEETAVDAKEMAETLDIEPQFPAELPLCSHMMRLLSSSKLKMIKNYLRPTMSQEHLVELAMMSIEHRYNH
ncbi:hypothetical protein PR048_018751 [Dryococelus australis]|uniref:Uncharacterized protein n=1 Tax=Dryococelus australis TaxID=614101 RepID=A0ABQ9HDX5_9NEOP|nr:hypothetical protein PR048_018751 [Dryococelus australis]